MNVVEIKLHSAEADRYFAEIVQRGTEARPLFQDIGEYLTESTKQRFETSTAPDGTRWRPNAPATHLAYLSKFSGSYDKSGKLSKAGARRAAGKKPLIGETGRLSREIYYQAGSDSVDIGSGLAYAAIHQFGGRAGRGLSVEIPAREFLGLSADDTVALRDMAASYLVP